MDPELFSAPVLQRVEEKWERELVTVPFFDGLLAGELDALIGSFAADPYHRIDIRRSSRHLVVREDDRVVADIQLVEDPAAAEA